MMKNFINRAVCLLGFLCLICVPEAVLAGTCENCHARISEIENNILPPLKDELAAIKADVDAYSKNAEDAAAAANAASNPISQAYYLSQQAHWNTKTAEKLTEAEAKQAQIDPYNAELAQLNACTHNEPPPPEEEPPPPEEEPGGDPPPPPPPPPTGHYETIDVWVITGSEWVITGGYWQPGDYMGEDEFGNPMYGSPTWIETGEWRDTGYWDTEEVWVED